jgi:predicted DNA-binding transcriptional regulator YafY
MSKRESIARYGLIINKLRRGPSSFDEIDFFLQNQGEIDGYNYRVSQRTFQRDINDIYYIHKIEIKFDYANRVYYIANEEDDQLGQRMLEAFDTFNALNTTERISQYIHFEKRHPQGTENFNGLLHAIRNKLVIKFTYYKFWNEKVSERIIEPYALKEFRNRWYVVGKDLSDTQIKSFGLDRLSDLNITKKSFKPSGFNVNEYYRNCFGIIAPNADSPSEVILSFIPFQGRYIKSMPLHESQQILIDNEEELRIKLKVFITEDLIMEILSHGERVKVIEPKSLVEDIKSIYEEVLEGYE